MPTTIAEEVKAKFTVDTNGLVDGVDRAKKAAKEMSSAFNSKFNVAKGSVLDPVGTAQAGIENALKGFGGNALLAGGLAAGITIAVKAMGAFYESAQKAQEQTHALDESSRALINDLSHTSSVQPFGELAGDMAKARDEQKLLKADLESLTGKTDNGTPEWLAQTIKNAQYALTRPTSGGFDGARQTDVDKKQMEIIAVAQRMQQIEANISKGFQDREDLIETTLYGYKEEVAAIELERQKQAELNELAKSGAETPERKSLIVKQYDLQIEKERALLSMKQDEWDMEQQILSLRDTALSTSAQEYTANEMRIAQMKKERDSGWLDAETKRKNELASLAIEKAQDEARRQSAMESGAQVNQTLQAKRDRDIFMDRAAARLAKDDNLINIDKDSSGRIVGGYDRITGEYRAPSQSYQDPNAVIVTGDAVGLDDTSKAGQRARDRDAVLGGEPFKTSASEKLPGETAASAALQSADSVSDIFKDYDPDHTAFPSWRRPSDQGKAWTIKGGPSKPGDISGWSPQSEMKKQSGLQDNINSNILALISTVEDLAYG